VAYYLPFVTSFRSTSGVDCDDWRRSCHKQLYKARLLSSTDGQFRRERRRILIGYSVGVERKPHGVIRSCGPEPFNIKLTSLTTSSQQSTATSRLWAVIKGWTAEHFSFFAPPQTRDFLWKWPLACQCTGTLSIMECYSGQKWFKTSAKDRQWAYRIVQSFRVWSFWCNITSYCKSFKTSPVSFQ